jgi:hypothetical protein
MSPSPFRLFRKTTALVFIALASQLFIAAQTVPETKPADSEIAWHDVTTWGLEGRAWPEMERLRWFDRLPAIAQGSVTDKVWDLSRDSSGMMVRFETDSAEIWVDYALQRPQLNGVNMTPIGASGLDLYARDQQGEWRWVGVARPNAQTIKQKIIDGLAPGRREYAIYLPLRNGIESLSVGVAKSAVFQPLAPRTSKPIVFYGTSITHGASASRPGMVHPAIIGRHLDRPVINLGFSGNGRMDAAVGELLVKIDAAVFVIDCLPNMGAELVLERCIPLVRQLRAERPETPIILVEDRRDTNSWILPARDAHHTLNHAALRKCYQQLLDDGVENLYYISGDNLLGHDSEGATDGSHPNDLGFMRQADIMEPVIKAAIEGRKL